MIRIPVEASRAYEVLIERGMLDCIGERTRAVTQAGTAVLVAGRKVWPLYGERAAASLERSGLRVERFLLEGGEDCKSLQTYGELLRFLAQKRVTRADTLVALGGGITGDLTGFAAATWQRGMDFIQVPTTLLAMVDSSVGGKTAVNLGTGKNQVGAFWQPAAVFCDPDTLLTLPEEEYRCGTAEVIKYGVLGDAAFFERLREKPIREQEEKTVETCVRMKRDIVREDEFDRGQRQLLNLGHSFAHAIEACSRFSILHGQAVAIGMAIMARAAAAKGFCTSETRDAIVDILRAYQLPTETDYPPKKLLTAMESDKKRAGSKLNLVVPEAIGRCTVVPVPFEELADWLRAGGIEA